MTKAQKAVYEAAMRWYRAVGPIGGNSGAQFFDGNGKATSPLHKLHRACAKAKGDRK